MPSEGGLPTRQTTELQALREKQEPLYVIRKLNATGEGHVSP